jgi:hypothetical protein
MGHIDTNNTVKIKNNFMTDLYPETRLINSKIAEQILSENEVLF